MISLSSGRAPAGGCGCCPCWSHHQQRIALPPVLVAGGQPPEGAGHGVPGCGSGGWQGGGPPPPPSFVVRPPASAAGAVAPPTGPQSGVGTPMLPSFPSLSPALTSSTTSSSSLSSSHRPRRSLPSPHPSHPSRRPPSPPPPPPHCCKCRWRALHDDASSKHLWTGFTSRSQATSVSVHPHGGINGCALQNLPTARSHPA